MPRQGSRAIQHRLGCVPCRSESLVVVDDFEVTHELRVRATAEKHNGLCCTLADTVYTWGRRLEGMQDTPLKRLPFIIWFLLMLYASPCTDAFGEYFPCDQEGNHSSTMKGVIVCNKAEEPTTQACEVCSGDSNLIFSMTRKTSLLRHISYARRRMRKSSVAKMMPEIAAFSNHFSSGALQHWMNQMNQDNEVIRKGLKMKLLRRAPSLRFSSLDEYMLRLHSEILADILDSHVTFANRIIPLIRADPYACAWYFHRKLLIQRREWKRLTGRVLNLVKLLVGIAGPDSQAAETGGLFRSDAADWPHRDRLRAALRRAAAAYEPFGAVDDASARLPRPRPPQTQAEATASL